MAGVAGCFMWRIGFTGELSYEIHVPAGVRAARVGGAASRPAPTSASGAFGVEAQRIMRLEKGHFIVGQDTDGLTQAFAVGLGSLIKLDKQDFAGRPELVWQQSAAGLLSASSACSRSTPRCVPPEACQIIERDGRHGSSGRITSSRMSPTLDRSICLGFVAPHLCRTRHAGDGPPARRRGRRRRCVMEHHAHVDPEGVRLRG